MANLNYLFQEFNDELTVSESKKSKMINSREHLREKIRKSFEQNHKGYSPKFYIQGSYKLNTLIRTKDDTCDLDDGVYFSSNPDNVTGTTLQRWVKEAVEGTTDATPTHKRKCIRVDYKAGYNIDLPVMVFDENTDNHPLLAVKNSDFQVDDPKEFVDYFKDNKTDQMVRIIKYLKAWCDHKRAEMPCGLAMTVLSLKCFQENDRDDVALKYILIEIEKQLKKNFRCLMPTTPKDDLFEDYSETKKKNFMDNLSSFIEDAKKAIEEPNHLKASKLWRKHLGERFPLGEDKSDENSKSLIKAIGTSKPYYNGSKQ
jgi:hypothetical protein